MVHIISADGKPLKPTNRHGHIRHLLDEGKAKVVRKNPFTVRLTYETVDRTKHGPPGIEEESASNPQKVPDEKTTPNEFENGEINGK